MEDDPEKVSFGNVNSDSKIFCSASIIADRYRNTRFCKLNFDLISLSIFNNLSNIKLASFFMLSEIKTLTY